MDQTGEAQDVVLLGCGRMGCAMLLRWIKQGAPQERFWVIDPNPGTWFTEDGVAEFIHMNEGLPEQAKLAVIAVKPQLMAQALPQLAALSDDTLFLSVAAGVPLVQIDALLGGGRRIVRAMPNTPASVGRGITALVSNARAGADGIALAKEMLDAVGQCIEVPDEGMMDAVTALSGSGPAYVFHLVEAMTAAGIAQGLPDWVAEVLARATVAGAGEMLHAAPVDVARLRRDVTSPGGTTEAALKLLMDPETGLSPLIARAIQAAADRSRELGA